MKITFDVPTRDNTEVENTVRAIAPAIPPKSMVISKHRRNCHDFCIALGQNFNFVDDHKRLFDASDITLVLLGRYWENPNWPNLSMVVQSRSKRNGWTIIEITDWV